MGNMDVDTGAPVSAAMMDCEWLDGGGGRLCRSIGVPLDEKRKKFVVLTVAVAVTMNEGY